MGLLVRRAGPAVAGVALCLLVAAGDRIFVSGGGPRPGGTVSGANEVLTP